MVEIHLPWNQRWGRRRKFLLIIFKGCNHCSLVNCTMLCPHNAQAKSRAAVPRTRWH